MTFIHNMDGKSDVEIMGETIGALRTELEAVKGERDGYASELKHDALPSLVAAQARIAELRAVVETASVDYRTVYENSAPLYCHLVGDFEACDDALATPDDLSALDRFHDATVEACAALIRDLDTCFESVQDAEYVENKVRGLKRIKL